MTGAPVFLKFARIAVLTGMLSFHARPASATEFYFDAGGGVTQILSASNFLGSTDSTLAMGGAFTGALGMDVSGAGRSLRFHFGILHKFLTGTDTAGSYGMQATYPFLRIEMKRFFLTLGATPLLQKNTGAGYISATGLGMLGEAGFMFPITPEIAFGLNAGSQWISGGGGLSPAPAFDLGGFFRFYFGKRSSGGSGMENYRGWRYPYGVELYN